jgi:hypothetical protein
VHDRAHGAQHRVGGLAHRHLPGIEFAVLAAHGDQDREREAALVHHAEGVDDVAHAARLHEEHAALAAQPRAGGQADAFLLGAQHDAAHARIGLAQLDQALVAGIRHVADDANAVLQKHPVHGERPIHSGGKRSVQGGRF